RLFDIELNGVLAQSGYDIWSEAGGKDRAVVAGFTVTASGGEGIALNLVNVTSAPAILGGIEVLRANPAGVAAPTVDLELSVDDGANWTTVATGLGVDRYGNGSYGWVAGPETAGNSARFRVVSNDGTQPVDDSDAGFLITNPGQDYYVNDADLTGDEYTTAVGDNSNSGKSPDAPMASIAGLLRAYDLDAGDVVHVDTGVYNLPTNITITADDAGVEIRGPVDPLEEGHQALLDRGNSNSGNYVFVLSNADDVTLSHLAITGGYRGIYASNSSDSDNVVFDALEVYGNAQEGIYLDTGNDNALLRDLDVHGNYYDGVEIRGAGTRVEGGMYYANSRGAGVYLYGTGVYVGDVEAHGNYYEGVKAEGSNAVVERVLAYNNREGIEVSGSG
ncbi:MAG: hypothetical protein GY713_07120, partial [Actinomycetia bacterium]|nr:hypothetical protein [Actinomycetes bacterium]